MKKLKKRFIVPAVVFILGMCALIGAIYVVGESQEQQNRTNAKLNAMTYTERIYGELMEGIGVTDTLKQVVISGDGNINKFYDIAENMMDDSIQSIQIAPNGVVNEIYPEDLNESGKIDLINDSDRGEISRYARDNDTVIMQGPFELKQGGYGIAVRNPVYLEDENGKKSFWGFTIVILKVPEIFSHSVEALFDFGYKYSLQKCASPWDDTYEWVNGSKEALNDPVIYDFDVYGGKWRLEILPKSGFYNNNYLIYMFIVLADDRSQLMRCADIALYKVKMRGKNGCMAYREGEHVKSRAKLGFAVKDIINNLPGAFIVYRADKENDEILLANSELLRLTGCKNMDELLAYTGKSFCNLIRPDEQESCQKSIWSQINGGHSNDYIFFHMQKADGKYISVLDHGRIVDSVHNGRVFYVMIMDLKSLQRHYGDCLELGGEVEKSRLLLP